MKRTILTLGLSMLCVLLSAQDPNLKMPRFFADGMVMQRDAKVPVWGTGTPRRWVTVRMAGKKSTVRVKKENYQHFESVDCQPAYFHKLTEVQTTHHIIEDIEINNSTVNYNATEEHFHIYFKDRY